MPRARLARAYLQEARSECLRYLRNPGFLLPTLLFPTVFYLMFGVLLARDDGGHAARYLLAAYATFGVMAPGLFGFGVSLAFERDNGLLTLKRALPMPPLAYLAGKLVMALCVAAVVASLLVAIALGVAHVALSPAQVLRLLATAVPGVLPFCALGMLVGTWIKGQGAPGVINLIYLPMAFLSGLWFPLDRMPALRGLAPVWPAWHLDQLAMDAVGLQQGAALPHVLALAAWTTVCLWIAARRLRRVG
ncbi:MAG: ABC transporter permease [Lysobacter sp.]|nr:ABC transporter permease [Lysobacter sp.]